MDISAAQILAGWLLFVGACAMTIALCALVIGLSHFSFVEEVPAITQVDFKSADVLRYGAISPMADTSYTTHGQRTTTKSAAHSGTVRNPAQWPGANGLYYVEGEKIAVPRPQPASVNRHSCGHGAAQHNANGECVALLDDTLYLACPCIGDCNCSVNGCRVGHEPSHCKNPAIHLSGGRKLCEACSSLLNRYDATNDVVL